MAVFPESGGPTSKRAFPLEPDFRLLNINTRSGLRCHLPVVVMRAYHLNKAQRTEKMQFPKSAVRNRRRADTPLGSFQVVEIDP